MGSPNRRICLQALLEEMLDIQNGKYKDIEIVKRVEQIIKKSHELIKGSECPNEIILDARVLQAGSQIVSANISSFDTNLTAFSEQEYTEGILSFLHENSDEDTVETAWQCFAPLTYHLYHKSDPPVFMIGSLSFDPPPAKDKVKVERNKKVAEAKTMLCEAPEVSDKEKKEAENIYEHMLKCLFRCYKSNNKKPLNFLEFIMNPDSFWDSVQNIFYFSFLVRDGHVSVFLDDKGLPVVEPLLKAPSDDSSLKTNHFSFSLNKQQWRECIKKFNITSPKIKPLKQN